MVRRFCECCNLKKDTIEYEDGKFVCLKCIDKQYDEIFDSFEDVNSFNDDKGNNENE